MAGAEQGRRSAGRARREGAGRLDGGGRKPGDGVVSQAQLDGAESASLTASGPKPCAEERQTQHGRMQRQASWSERIPRRASQTSCEGRSGGQVKRVQLVEVWRWGGGEVGRWGGAVTVCVRCVVLRGSGVVSAEVRLSRELSRAMSCACGCSAPSCSSPPSIPHGPSEHLPPAAIRRLCCSCCSAVCSASPPAAVYVCSCDCLPDLCGRCCDEPWR